MDVTCQVKMVSQLMKVTGPIPQPYKMIVTQSGIIYGPFFKG